MTAPEPSAVVACRKCGRPVAFAADYCPKCGCPDPSGRRSALVGATVFGALLAGVLTGIYAWLLSEQWARLEEKCASLPPNHLMHDAPWETAIGFGIAVFLAAWVVTVAILAHLIKPAAARR